MEFIDGIISDDCDNTYQIVNNSEDDILEPVSLAPDNDSESEVAELYNDCDNYPLSAEVESYTDDDDAYEEEEDTSTDMMRYGSQRHLPLYDGAPLSEFTSSLMIMKFKMRHNLTDQCLADLLHLLRLHCPVPNHCPSSLYLFKKNFVETKFPINYHYFCSACLQSVNITDDSCSNNLCMSKFEKIGSRSSFIEIPIEPQIQTLFKS